MTVPRLKAIDLCCCAGGKKPEFGTAEYTEYLWSLPRTSQRRPININALDPIDPVHYRRHRARTSENDYDGDMGREHSDYLQDNGKGARATVAGTFIQIGDLAAEALAKAGALPVIDGPSIVSELPETTSEKVKSNV